MKLFSLYLFTNELLTCDELSENESHFWGWIITILGNSLILKSVICNNLIAEILIEIFDM